MKRQMFEVLVDPSIREFGCNFVRTRISEFEKGKNYPVPTDICHDDPKSINECLRARLEKLLTFASEHMSKFMFEKHDKIIVFHRSIGDKREMFVTLQDQVIGTPIHWLD